MISKNRFMTAAATLSALALSTTPAAAQSYSWWNWRHWWGGWSYGGGGGSSTSSVPEIDASTGALALAAVAAGLLLTREMLRRRKSLSHAKGRLDK